MKVQTSLDSLFINTDLKQNHDTNNCFLLWVPFAKCHGLSSQRVRTRPIRPASCQIHKAWRPLKVWATIVLFSRGRCHLPLGLKQGYPFHSPYECRLGYHQFKAWPVKQKALPPKFLVKSAKTGIWTHTLLIKQQSLNLVLLTAQPWHVTSLLHCELVFTSLVTRFN